MGDHQKQLARLGESRRIALSLIRFPFTNAFGAV